MKRPNIFKSLFLLPAFLLLFVGAEMLFADDLTDYYEDHDLPPTKLVDVDNTGTIESLHIRTILGIIQYELERGQWGPEMDNQTRRELLEIVKDPALTIRVTSQQSLLSSSAGGQTTDANTIRITESGLYTTQGSRGPHAHAQLIFHEMGHVWQKRHQIASDWRPWKESWPTQLEGMLPSSNLTSERLQQLVQYVALKDECRNLVAEISRQSAAGNNEATRRSLQVYNDKNCYNFPGYDVIQTVEQKLEEAEKKDKEEREAALGPIRSNVAACEYEKALSLARELQLRRPSDPWLAANMSDLETVAQQQKEARDLLRTAQTQLRSRQIDDSLDTMERARQAAPGCMATQIQSLIDQINKDLNDFKDATSRAADAGNACDYEKALVAAQEAERMSPTHPWVIENLPKIRALLNEKKKAEALIQEAVALSQSASKPEDWDPVTAKLEAAQSVAPGCMMDRIRTLLDAARQSKKPKPMEKSIILLIDTSGSMADNNKIVDARNAANAAVRKMGPGVEIAVLAYSGGCGSSVNVAQGFTNDANALTGAVNSLSPGGGTPMAPALAFASDYLRRNGRGKTGEIILLCDGQNDCGSVSYATNAVRQSTIPTSVSTIGFSIPPGSAGDTDLRNIAAQTGGRAYNAANRNELIHAFSRAFLMNAIKKDDPSFQDPATGQQMRSYFQRAQEMLDKQDFEGALFQYKQALKLAPDSPAVNFNLSMVYEEQDQLTPAIRHAEKYLQLAPQSFDGSDVKARVANMKQELTRNPRELLDQGSCPEIYRWAKKAYDRSKKAKPAVKAAILEVMIAAQKGDCEAAAAGQRRLQSEIP